MGASKPGSDIREPDTVTDSTSCAEAATEKLSKTSAEAPSFKFCDFTMRPLTKFVRGGLGPRCFPKENFRRAAQNAAPATLPRSLTCHSDLSRQFPSKRGKLTAQNRANSRIGTEKPAMREPGVWIATRLVTLCDQAMREQISANRNQNVIRRLQSAAKKKMKLQQCLQEIFVRVFIKAAAALSCAILCSVIGGGAANAAPIQSFDSGWYTNSGFTAGVNNINVGSSNLSGAIYHNWLAFNLAGLANQTVTGATLTFLGGNGVNTSSTSETLGLFDYTGSINALIADSQFNVGIYTDLGDGKNYGTALVATGAIQEFSVILSPEAIAGLNAAAHDLSDSRFVIGGSLLSISGPFANEQLFAIFGPQTALSPAAFLTLQTSATPVPEPSTWAMMILGIAGIGFLAMRRRTFSATA